MFKAPVRLDDDTDHGGKVITATSSLWLDGKPVALEGDLVSCPKKGHGTNPIIEGSDTWINNGRRVVVHGCHAACGCRVLASSASAGENH